MFITIQENNILTLCNSVVETATRNDIALLDEAEQIRNKYHKLFKLFADCHNIYNSSKFLVDSEINDLGKILLHQYQSYIVMMPTIFTESNICNFLDYYRSNFPTATITPKLHMLEDHIIPWIRQWHVGFGLMGEQGAESIHAAFNYDERIYANLGNRVEKLKSVLQNHHLKITPSNVVLQPPSKKYTKKSQD